MDNKIRAGLIILLVIAISFGYAQYRENQKYEKYVSHQLFNEISHLSWSTVLNSFLLDDVLSAEKITKKQLSLMKDKYSDIGKSGGKVVDLADTWLKRIDSEEYHISPYPVYMASDFFYYLERLERDDLKEKEYIDLTSEDIKKFKLMQSVNDVWVKAITENIEGINIPSPENVAGGAVKQKSDDYVTTDNYQDMYYNKMVNTEDWVEMIRQMQEASQEYEREVEHLF